MSLALEGSWLPIAAWISGEVLPIGELRVSRLELQRGEYQIFDRQQRLVDSGEYRCDPNTAPMQLDIVGIDGPNAGPTMLAIFEVSEKLLMVCYDMDGTRRPQSTEPQEDQVTLVITYARAPPLAS